MVEHIDTKRLHTDSRYRFDYVSKFLNFTSTDIEALNQLAPIIFPRIPVIVDTVYRKLFSCDVTKNSFFVQNKGCDNLVSDSNFDLQFHSQEISLRREMLGMYLKRVLTQRDWNDTFLQYLSQIGRIHTNKSGTTSVNVDYIHINVLLGYLNHFLIETLWKIETIDDTKRLGMVTALNKFFWIQNDFFTQHYIQSDDQPVTNEEIKSNKVTFACCFPR